MSRSTQYSKQLQHIYLFRQENRFFLADLIRYQAVEIDELTWQILKRYDRLSDGSVIRELKSSYPEEEIRSALEHLKKFERDRKEFEITRSKERPRYLCPNPQTFVANIRYGTGGLLIALHYLIKALGKYYVDVDICRGKSETLDEGIYAVPFYPEDPAFIAHLLNEDYRGILLQSTRDTFMIPFLRFLPVPVVVPLYALRGHSGLLINQVFLWYSALRDCDAFVVPTNSVKSFYAQYLMDEGCFYVSHYGVDHELFRPMDKRKAKRKVAQMLGDERIMKKPIVGFLSRLQPEKGGGTYLQIARMIPDALFVAVAPTLMFYEHVSLPDNFIYAGPQPRENLPLFFNAFDIHCFPSVVGEETFGMVALEAMACGTPVVASRFDGIPEVVGDTGVLVPAETYSDEMGSIAGYVSAEEMAKAIRELLDNPERRLRLGEMAHRRALGFTWEKAARELVELFDELNRRLRYPSPQRPEVSVFFTPFLHESDGSLDYQSILAGITEDRKRLLMFEAYIQSVEEGLALALLKHHTWHEVEVILYRFCGREEAKTLLRRVRQFLQALSV